MLTSSPIQKKNKGKNKYVCPRKVIHMWVFLYATFFSDRFVSLFASQVLHDDLNYVATRGMLSTIVGNDRVDKIIVDIWANILNASELKANRSHVQRICTCMYIFFMKYIYFRCKKSVSVCVCVCFFSPCVAFVHEDKTGKESQSCIHQPAKPQAVLKSTYQLQAGLHVQN